MYSREKHDMVLKAHNISMLEYLVLAHLGYRIPLTKEETVSQILWEGREQLVDEHGKLDPNLSEELGKTIDLCIEKGWIRILSAEDIASQEAFIKESNLSEDFPEFIELEGCLDFNESGYLLILQVINEIHIPWEVDHHYLRFLEINR